MSNIAIIQGDLAAIEPDFNRVLVDKSINFHREAGFAVQVLESNDFALKVAMSNRQSVINAVTNCAAIGISLNPAKKQAYLVPRGGKICLDISYMGLIDLAVQDKAIVWAKAELVREADAFTLHAVGQAPTHSRDPFRKDAGEIVGVYCVWKTVHGDVLCETMTIADAHRIRDRSESWKRGQSGPWKTDEGEMIRKTVIKRASKYWSGTSSRLDEAINLLNTEGGEGVTDVPHVDTGFDVIKALDLVEQCSGLDELAEIWKNQGKAATSAKDRGGWSALRDAVQSKRSDLERSARSDATPDDDGVIDVDSNEVQV